MACTCGCRFFFDILYYMCYTNRKVPLGIVSDAQLGIRIKSPRQKTPWKKFPRKNSWNAVEREPVETRVLNLNASEASYKPEQRNYRKTKLKTNIFLFLLFFGGILSWNHPIEVAPETLLYITENYRTEGAFN